MQTAQRIFNLSDIQVLYFFVDKIGKLLTYHLPSYHVLLQSYQLSTLSRFFGPPCRL